MNADFLILREAGKRVTQSSDGKADHDSEEVREGNVGQTALN